MARNDCLQSFLHFRQRSLYALRPLSLMKYDSSCFSLLLNLGVNYTSLLFVFGADLVGFLLCIARCKQSEGKHIAVSNKPFNMEKGAENESLFFLLGWYNDLLSLFCDIFSSLKEKIIQPLLTRLIWYVFFVLFKAEIPTKR